jgi:hypothetical protein
MTAVTDEYCGEIVDQVTPLQEELRERLGTVFAFLGDEFYIRSGRRFRRGSITGSFALRALTRIKLSADRRRCGNGATVL